MVLGSPNRTPLIRPTTSNISIKNTPIQTDRSTCGMHMLLINLATNCQGNIPNLLHTQIHAETLSKMHLRFVLEGELDPQIAHLTHKLSNTNPTRAWTPNTAMTAPGRTQ